MRDDDGGNFFKIKIIFRERIFSVGRRGSSPPDSPSVFQRKKRGGGGGYIICIIYIYIYICGRSREVQYGTLGGNKRITYALILRPSGPYSYDQIGIATTVDTAGIGAAISGLAPLHSRNHH